MTPAPLFADLRPTARPRTRRRAASLSLQVCLDAPVSALSDRAFRAWTYLRLLPRSTSVRHARALLDAHALAPAVPELEQAGFLVSHAAPASRPKAFSAVVPVIIDREALVIQHRPLVDMLARRLAKRLPRHVDVDDLTSEGYVALLKAAQRYDPSTGVPFGAYARRRVTGGLLDALRRIDPLSRRDRAAVTAGNMTWDEVALDEARDTPTVSPSEARAAERGERRAEAMLDLVVDSTDREIVRRVVIDEDLVTDVAAEMGLTVREVQHRHDVAIRRLRAKLAPTCA